MVGVTVEADKVGIVLAKRAVKRGWILPLSGHVGVTDHTPVCHRGAAPEGNVTQVTLSGDLCM
jgi:hypothetical protein